MAGWVTVNWIKQFFAQLNVIAPNRDRAGDGTIGNLAHQGSSSGHNPDETGNPEERDADNINEVRALDIGIYLKLAGVNMEMVIQHLLKLARAGKLTFLRYIIFNKRIWRAASGWKQEVYHGSDPHDTHAHLSGKASGDDATNVNFEFESLVGGKPGAAPGTGRKTPMLGLRHGDKGEEVKVLQLLLERLGKRPDGGADGDYGDATAKKVSELVGGDGKTIDPGTYLELTAQFMRAVARG